MGDQRRSHLMRRDAMASIDRDLLAQALRRPTAQIAPLSSVNNLIPTPIHINEPTPPPVGPSPITSFPIPEMDRPKTPRPSPRVSPRTSPRRRAEESIDDLRGVAKVPMIVVVNEQVQVQPEKEEIQPVFSNPHSSHVVVSNQQAVQKPVNIWTNPNVVTQFPSFAATNTTATFGSTTTTTPGTSLFSSAKPTLGGGGGLFGSSTTTSTQQQQQQAQVNTQQQVIQSYHPFVRACGNPQLIGTDDDKSIAHLNQVAAALGIGKAPYKDGNQVQTYNMEGNYFEKFVGIGYNKISDRTDDEGVVSLVLNVPIQEIASEERKLKVLEAITNILGNQQNLRVEYAPGTNQFRPISENATEISIIVKEGGFVVGACKLAQVLNDTNRLAQLETQLKVDKNRVLPKVGLSKAQKEKYLETVPNGVDERIWRQAIAENPAPNRMLPVVVRGWEALRDRQKSQIAERKVYQEALESLAERVEKAENYHAQAQVEIEAARCRHKQLSYRLLRVLLAQWITQRYSKPVDTDEDRVEAQTDTLLAKLNRHNQLKDWIRNFYETLENHGDKLRAGAEKAYDMSQEDQHYARKFLTEILYVGERLVETNQLQMEDLEAIRRTLEGE